MTTKRKQSGKPTIRSQKGKGVGQAQTDRKPRFQEFGNTSGEGTFHQTQPSSNDEAQAHEERAGRREHLDKDVDQAATKRMRRDYEGSGHDSESVEDTQKKPKAQKVKKTWVQAESREEKREGNRQKAEDRKQKAREKFPPKAQDPVVVNNNFYPPIPLPPAPKMPKIERGSNFELPAVIRLQQFTDRFNQVMFMSVTIGFAVTYLKSYFSFLLGIAGNIRNFRSYMISGGFKQCILGWIGCYVVSKRYHSKQVLYLEKTSSTLLTIVRHDRNRVEEQVPTEFARYQYVARGNSMLNTCIAKAQDLYTNVTSWRLKTFSDLLFPSLRLDSNPESFMTRAANKMFPHKTEPNQWGYKTPICLLPEEILLKYTEETDQAVDEFRTETVNRELFQRLANPRTLNTHLPFERLMKNIENAASNATDINMCEADLINETNSITSTVTVMKHVATASHQKTAAMGFHEGPTKSSTSTAIEFSNSGKGGGLHSQQFPNSIQPSNTAPMSMRESFHVNRFSAVLGVTLLAFAYLTLTYSNPSAPLLESSSVVQPLSHLLHMVPAFCRKVLSTTCQIAENLTDKMLEMLKSFLVYLASLDKPQELLDEVLLHLRT